MGIIANAACLLMQDGIRKPYSGKLLQLGKQSVHLTYEQLQYLANFVGFTLTPIVPVNGGRLSDIDFFRALGFADVLSMEFATTEGADYVWDLNNPVPNELKSRFDCIYDGGTLEHVFNVPGALANICSMLAVGGRVVHDSPTSGYIDHGFYSLQPTLYHDFYTAQNFEVDNLLISKLNKETVFTHTAELISYVPGMYDFERTWAIDGKVHMTFCVATKREEFLSMNTPQQSIWNRARK